ncbi:MAG TPA: hypothetical protein DCY55_02335 [Gammaproteobacteria bacterium]|jgi:hypothetical protein|nr:hypothetical protein [Gammaproteobacteria bacterium]
MPREIQSLKILPAIDPKKRLQFAVIGVVVTLVLMVSSFYFGKYMSGSNELLYRAQVAELEVELESFEQYKETLALAQGQLQITKEAYGGLKDSLMQCDANIVSVQHELAFYQSIISPEDGESGLKIHDLQLDKLNDTSFLATLVLLQSIQHDDVASGSVRMEVVSEDGNEVIGKWPETDSKRFDLRYFEKITGQIDLPAGVSAERIHVVVDPDGQSDDIDRWYSWHHLTQQNTL